MQTLQYAFSSEIPVTHEADVIVVGGGPGGLGAAVTAARAGVRTLLVERYAALGGMASYGEVHPFMVNHADGVCLDKPVYLDWIKAMKKYLANDNPAHGLSSAEAGSGEDRAIHKEAVMLGSEDLCQQAGVSLLYHHALVDVIREGDRISALVLSSKSGLTAVRAKVYIDCTGDGDLAARAGCEFEMGGPSGHCQPMTLCFKLRNIDKKRSPGGGEITELYKAARARGEIDCVREDVLQFAWLADDVVHFNTTRVIHKNGTNGVELSDAEIDARRQVREYLTFFREHVSGYEACEILSMAHHIGVRETRRVKGRAYLTREAFEQKAKFADAIARVRYMIDIHNPDGTGTEHQHMPEGEWYEIPYGCVVAKDVDNLTIGGRPISVDHAIHSSMRVMPPACSVGQGAGMGAALAVQKGISPGEVDGVEVRAALKSQGAFL